MLPWVWELSDKLFECWYYFLLYTQKRDTWITGNFYFNFFEHPLYCFHSGCTNSSSYQQCIESLFSTSPPMLITSYLFDDSQSNRHEVIAHWWFWFTVLRWLVVLSTFSYTCWLLVYVFFREMYFHVLCFGIHSKILTDTLDGLFSNSQHSGSEESFKTHLP